MNSTISILGLYNADPSLFDDMQLPEALEREKVINGILLKCSELEVLYPDPEYMKNALRIWSGYRVTVWQSLYETTQYEYNPIWNKDGTITETESRNTSSSASGSGTGQQAVKAFNESSWADHTKNTSSSEAASNETEGITRERKEQGNIGVTTTQQMIREERDISEFNVIQYIIDDFQNEFCLQIY